MKTVLKQRAWLIGAIALYLSVAVLTASNVSTWAPQSQQVQDPVQPQPIAAVRTLSSGGISCYSHHN